MLNLDTHIPIKAFEGTLTPRKRIVLTADPEWSISATVLWEITKLRQLRRIEYGLDNDALADAVERYRIWPITRQVCLNLRALDFESDPADEIIAATSLSYGISVDTRFTDAEIEGSKTGIEIWASRRSVVPLLQRLTANPETSPIVLHRWMSRNPFFFRDIESRSSSALRERSLARAI